MSKERICVKCGDEYILVKGKPGLINECRECGKESEKGIPRLGGTMIYSHKTAAEIQIGNINSIKQFNKISARSGKKSNLGKASRGTEL